MKNKIRLYESEIKRAIRRKLMERYIDEVEQMDVYKKDEIDLSTVKPGTYGLKDEKGNIKSITVNEEDSDDEYYGTFDDVYKVDKSNVSGDFNYDEYDEEQYSDFDSFRGSKYGINSKNKWDFNSPNEEQGRSLFNKYLEKYDNKPFSVRRKK